MTPKELAALAVDAAFGTFGTAAIYRPPEAGPPVPCRLIRNSADRTIAFGEGRPFAEGATVEVRTSEVAAPEAGGTFDIDGETLTILHDPVFGDAERLVWSCTVR